MKSPNLFHFATSELSQDAVLCWIISWACPQYANHPSGMQNIGNALLQKIFTTASRTLPLIESLKIRQQDGGADIVCLINNSIALIIEDKVGTQEHHDQLRRYKEYVREKYKYSEENIVGAYIQTGDQCEYKKIIDAGYITIRRSELLQILEGTTIELQSEILSSFTEHIRSRENEVESYKNIPISEWKWNAWIGFYTKLKESINAGHWDYVPNPSGGFLGFWWGTRDAGNCDVYLQLEQKRFCFKISVDEPELRSKLRNDWYRRIAENCPNHGITARRPDRFGNGQYMTVAIFKDEYRATKADGTLDMEGTIQNLKSAEMVLDTCLQKYNV